MADIQIKTILLTALSVFFLAACSKSSSENSFQGYIEGDLTYIAAPYSGQLKQLFVERGELVTENQKLFTLDPQPQSDQFVQAKENLQAAEATLANLEQGERKTILEAIQAQIDQAQANLALAQIRLTRYQKLLAKNATSRDEYDQALATYKAQLNLVQQLKANLAEAKLGSRADVIQAQKFSVAAAEAQLKEAQWALAQKNQYAPVAGIIFDKYFYLGELVPANQPVVSMLAPSDINIIFFLPETQLGQFKIGQIITIHCDACAAAYKAKIYYISPEAEYTPPVIYSRDSNAKLVYRIKAKPITDDPFTFHPGQPVMVTLTNS